MKIYVIGGKAKSGKNVFGEYLKDELKKYGKNPCLIRITEPLYSYAKTYFSWNVNTTEKPREFLQKMGIEIIKEKLGKKTFLLDRLFEDIEILSNFFDTFIITDARLIAEFTSIKAKYPDVTTIKLNRENYDDQLTPEEKNHITETELDSYNDFDYIINNTSFEQLKKEAQNIIKKTEGEII